MFIEEKKARHVSPTQSSKDGEELEQVVGNAEDDIGDRLATIRESELLFGENSLLAVYGPMLAHICRNPGRFKVRAISFRLVWPTHSFTNRTGPFVGRPSFHSANSFASAPSTATNGTQCYSIC